MILFVLGFIGGMAFTLLTIIVLIGYMITQIDRVITEALEQSFKSPVYNSDRSEKKERII